MMANEGVESLQRRAKWARGFLMTYIAVVILAFPFGIVLGLVSQQTLSPQRWVLFGVAGAAVLSLALMLGAAISVPLWVYRAWSNLKESGLGGLGYTPRWAALSFFVPIAGLFVPFGAMRELYNRSMGEDEYQARATVGDVTSWWACYIGAWFVQFFQLGVQVFNMNGALLIVAPPIIRLLMAAIGVLAILGSAFLLWRIIGKITAAQESSVHFVHAFA